MEFPIINYWAVIVCGVLSMILGMLWYGPLFGKLWMRLIGKNVEQIRAEMKYRNMPAIYGLQFLAALVMAYVLSLFISFIRVHTIWDGIMLGLWIGIGFVLTSGFGGYAFENRPSKLFWVNHGYTLVQLAIFGAILAGWR